MFGILPQNAAPISAAALNFAGVGGQSPLAAQTGALTIPGIDTDQLISRANPQFNALGGGSPGLDMWGKADVALSGLQTLGGLWNAFQAQKLAKKQFNFTKDFTTANLNNQTQAYNTAISDRARSRGFTEGQSQQEIDSYVSANSLKKFG